MPSRQRVVFVQPYIPAYREPFFRALRERLRSQAIELVVGVDRVSSSRFDGSESQADVVVGSRTPGHVRWRSLSSLRLETSDLVVMEQALRNLEVYQLLGRRRNRRPGIALWGHGRSSVQGQLSDWVKQVVTRRADWFFAYTDRGRDWVVQEGFPRDRVTVVGNTMDARALAEDLCAVTRADLESFVGANRLDPLTSVLFLGAVDHSKDIDYLIRVSRCFRELVPTGTIVLAGDGDAMPAVSAAVPTSPGLRPVGRLEGHQKAVALRSCRVLAIPRGVGLVAVDSAVSGVPVVTRQGCGHGPEIDVLPEGELYILERSVPPRQFALALAHLIGAETRQFDTEQCVKRGQLWGIEAMADRFTAGLLEWSSRRVSRSSW